MTIRTCACCFGFSRLKSDSVQLLHLQTVRRIVGPPRLTSLDSSLSFVPFMHILPALRHLRLDGHSDWSEERSRTTLDLGPLAAVPTLRVLDLEATRYYLQHLDRLTQLEALVLTDVAHPVGTQASGLRIPLSLTRLELQTSGWEDPADPSSGRISEMAKPQLHSFNGHLLSLTLDPHFLCEMKDGLRDLSALACLQQLTYLKLGSVMGTPIDGQLALSSLQSLRLQMIDWPAGPHPRWDLTRCPALQTLSLELYTNEPEDDCVIDLRGIRGCLAATLHVKLGFNLEDDLRALADFSGWMLKAVYIKAGQSRGRWHAEQSVRDLIGALACHLPFSNVFVDNKRLAYGV